MAHEVKFSIPERELGRADIEFSVKRNATKLGTLKVSKGSVVWVPKDKTYGHTMGWDQFDEVMKAVGKREGQ